jgi:gliding motility-associated-like protein
MDEKKGGAGSGAGVYLAYLAGALILGGTVFYAVNSGSNSSLNSELAEVIGQDPSDNLLIESTIEDEQIKAVESVTLDRVSTSPSFEGSEAPSSTAGAQPLTKMTIQDGSSDPVGEPVAQSTDVSTNPVPQSITLQAISTHNGIVNSPEPKTSPADEEETTIGFSTSLDESCSGTTITFQLDKVKDGVIYLWNFGDGSFSNKPEPDHVYERAGSYAVTLSMTHRSGGPIENKMATEKIEIYDAPTSAFVHAQREEIGKLPYVHFENNSRSAVKWEWDFGDGTTSNETHPDHIYRKAGTYPVTLTVTNAKGCKDQLSLPVTVTKENNLKAPKTFSPNGDGLKDTFLPESLKELKSPFKLSIFETTGGLVYTTENVEQPWNGRSDQGTGEVMPAGDYVWVVDFVDGHYKGETFQGKVSLLH